MKVYSHCALVNRNERKYVCARTAHDGVATGVGSTPGAELQAECRPQLHQAKTSRCGSQGEGSSSRFYIMKKYLLRQYLKLNSLSFMPQSSKHFSVLLFLIFFINYFCLFIRNILIYLSNHNQ